MSKLRFLHAESFDQSGAKVGRIVFPYPNCVPCMAGMYDTPTMRPENSAIHFAVVRHGAIVFSACDDYLDIPKCPYFQKVQAALRQGRKVRLTSYSHTS